MIQVLVIFLGIAVSYVCSQKHTDLLRQHWIKDESNLFAQRQTIKIPQTAPIHSVVVSDGTQITLVTKNRTLMYYCNKLQNCTQTPIQLFPTATSELSDVSVSSDLMALFNCEKNGVINVFWQFTDRKYHRVTTFTNSTLPLNAIRNFNQGDLFVAGGDDGILWCYSYNRTNPNKYNFVNRITTQGPIIDLAINSIKNTTNSIFVASGDKVSIFASNITQGLNANFQYLSDLNWGKGQITAVDSLADTPDMSYSIVAMGGKSKNFAVYQFNTSLGIYNRIYIEELNAPVLSVALSALGKYLAVGKSDQQTRIYSQITLNGTISYAYIQSMQSEDKISNLTRSLKFVMNDFAFVEARDDFTLRTYTIGGCPSGSHLHLGVCIADSNLLITIGTVVGAVAIMLIIVYIVTKIKPTSKKSLQTTLLEDDQNNTPSFGQPRFQHQVDAMQVKKLTVKSHIDQEPASHLRKNYSRSNDAFRAENVNNPKESSDI